MKALIFPMFAAMLAGCASAPLPRNVEPLFSDALFPVRPEVVRAEDIFALSGPMRDFLDNEIAGRVRRRGPRLGLFETLRDELRIEYDSAMTRTAAQAFAARSGNCLSLVILTAAFARQLKIPIHYQSVHGQDTWSRSGGIAFRSGHVNLVLGARPPVGRLSSELDRPLTMDFLPPGAILRQDAVPIAEETVVAMYMNNRAAEIMADGNPGRAYWWAREAIRTAPSFTNSYNTLGVIYLRHGNLPQAEQALGYALEREPDNVEFLSNLSEILARQGRAAQARELRNRVAQIAPYPPFHFFDLGMAALARGDNEAAAELFKKELARMPYDDELHFVMAVARLRLGEMRQARKHMTLAMENSTTRTRHNIYAAKLDHLKSLQAH